jgi:hypothetical protein
MAYRSTIKSRYTSLGGRIVSLCLVGLLTVSSSFVSAGEEEGLGEDPVIETDTAPAEVVDESKPDESVAVKPNFKPNDSDDEIVEDAGDEYVDNLDTDVGDELDEMRELASEIGENFSVLHRMSSADKKSKESGIISKMNMCAATQFAERKSMLPHMKFGKKTKVATVRKGNALKAFMADVKPLRNQIKAESQRRSEIRAGAIESVIANFQSSCRLDFKKFIPEIKKQAKKRQIPVETLLAMITIESGGDCFASVAEGGNDPVTGKPLFSRGLFQVHANFTKYHGCTDKQKKSIQGAKSIAALRKGPRCVENPILNLEAAAKVLEDKAKALAKNSQPYEIFYLSESKTKGKKHCWLKKTIHVAGFDAKRLRDKKGKFNRNLWRMAVSAYNGGERWVFRAKRNIEVFNKLHGTSVNAYDWDSLKDYYFRRTLTRQQQLRYFGVQERDRDLDYAILNVMYAETLVPSGSASRDGRGNLAQQWQDGYLRGLDQKHMPASIRD